MNIIVLVKSKVNKTKLNSFPHISLKFCCFAQGQHIIIVDQLQLFTCLKVNTKLVIFPLNWSKAPRVELLKSEIEKKLPNKYIHFVQLLKY